jgi:hypothetical protein
MEVTTMPHRHRIRSRFPAARAIPSAALLTVALLAAPPARAADFVERFAQDLLDGAGRFVAEGDAGARFTFLPGTPPRFAGDRAGTLRVLYDTTVPTARIGAPLGAFLTPGEDFEFGAILTLRSEGFLADPNGFSQVAFGLWNGATTGLNRTGFPSDAYDLLEFDYFPNVTAFGGPFVSPTVFGGNVGDNAFSNFAFASAEAPLPLEVPLLIQARHDGAARALQVTVRPHAAGVFFQRTPIASVTVDLSRLDPGFQVNVAGIAGYFEGYASIHVEADYDLLYVGSLPEPFGVAARRRLPGGR